VQTRYLICILGLAASYVANADVIYNNPAAWQNAVSGATTINFEGIAPVNGYTYIGSGPGTSFTLGGVQFAIGPASNGNLFIIGDNFYYPGTAVISSQESTTPVNDLLITLPRPVTALGFFFGDFDGDTATITLSDGTVAFPTAVEVPYLGFFGVTSNIGITSVGISAVDITTPDIVLNVASLSTGVVSPEPAEMVPLLALIALLAARIKKYSVGNALRITNASSPTPRSRPD
jgi:hypothetical protein